MKLIQESFLAFLKVFLAIACNLFISIRFEMFDIRLKAARAFLRASFACLHSLFHQMAGLALIGLERVNDLGGQEAEIALLIALRILSYWMRGDESIRVEALESRMEEKSFQSMFLRRIR